MFTGIVTDLGEVREVESRGDLHLVIGTAFETGAIPLGSSIACSGICLTVVDKGEDANHWFAVTASGETASRTTVSTWSRGTPINLERPVRVGDELGGHIVTGHVDGTAALLERIADGESLRMTFAAPEELAPYIAPKGSVALDGVSLTVNEVAGAQFTVNIIPHTRRMTSLGQLHPRGRANIEIDLLARYVQRLLKA